ncbi:hypothetical protein N7466_010553 [Penicillium verhagenii]|uniref:uncharacterized protein n=1 Tax=Penicillium verhagenii TaxID=1562060 RepID=UPI0025450FD4|nr:uncharacterized protein N7466_010553 [Penicillium verhagenii]KAJ5918561.1 hypothetical protein N7466_010553 [Penicillium verhagenii]
MEQKHFHEKRSSTERALSITEILEAILLHLDLCTILTTAQLVNRGWRQLIRESTQIQEALFFKPEKPRRRRSEPIFNPLLLNAFPSLFPKPGGTSSIISFKSLDMVQTPEKLAAYARKDASWRNMLVQQPPITEFAFVDVTHAMAGDFFEQFRLNNLKGNIDLHGRKHRGLRMDTLFGYILFSPRFYFSDFSTAKVGWSTEEFSAPSLRGHNALKRKQEFEAMMKRFRLFIHNRRVIQCVVGRDSQENEEQVLRHQIQDAYVEASLDLNWDSAETIEVKYNLLKDIIDGIKSHVESITGFVTGERGD